MCDGRTGNHANGSRLVVLIPKYIIRVAPRDSNLHPLFLVTGAVRIPAIPFGIGQGLGQSNMKGKSVAGTRTK